MIEKQKPIDALAYPPAHAAKVVGRSHSRIKKAVREGEITARKDGRATLIEHAELVRWLASLPTIGRPPAEPVPELVQKAMHVAAKSSATIERDYQSRVRPSPSSRPRALASRINALEDRR